MRIELDRELQGQYKLYFGEVLQSNSSEMTVDVRLELKDRTVDVTDVQVVYHCSAEDLGNPFAAGDRVAVIEKNGEFICVAYEDFNPRSCGGGIYITTTKGDFWIAKEGGELKFTPASETPGDIKAGKTYRWGNTRYVILDSGHILVGGEVAYTSEISPTGFIVKDQTIVFYRTNDEYYAYFDIVTIQGEGTFSNISVSHAAYRGIDTNIMPLTCHCVFPDYAKCMGVKEPGDKPYTPDCYCSLIDYATQYEQGISPLQHLVWMDNEDIYFFHKMKSHYLDFGYYQRYYSDELWVLKKISRLDPENILSMAEGQPLYMVLWGDNNFIPVQVGDFKINKNDYFVDGGFGNKDYCCNTYEVEEDIWCGYFIRVEIEKKRFLHESDYKIQLFDLFDIQSKCRLDYERLTMFACPLEYCCSFEPEVAHWYILGELEEQGCGSIGCSIKCEGQGPDNWEYEYGFNLRSVKQTLRRGNVLVLSQPYNAAGKRLFYSDILETPAITTEQLKASVLCNGDSSFLDNLPAGYTFEDTNTEQAFTEPFEMEFYTDPPINGVVEEEQNEHFIYDLETGQVLHSSENLTPDSVHFLDNRDDAKPEKAFVLSAYQDNEIWTILVDGSDFTNQFLAGLEISNEDIIGFGIV